jgi:hypothetical protein
MAIATTLPMAQVRPLHANQQINQLLKQRINQPINQPINQQRTPQQRVKPLKAVLLILPQSIKPKQALLQLPENYPVKDINSGTDGIR